MDIGFAPNYTNLHLIDATPHGSERTWLYLGPGITSIEPDNTETIDDTAYYDGGGVEGHDVTGLSMGFQVEGDRLYGDPAQELIVGMIAEIGEGRKTNMKRIAPDGRAYEGPCTVTDIKDGGGDANDKGDFGCNIKFDGLPEITPASKTALPESVSLSAVTVAKDATVALAPTVLPATASGVCVYAVEDPTIASVDAVGNLTGLKAGTTKVTAKCMAKPSVVATANVTVTAASADATLSALSIGSLTLSPTFDKDTTAYTASTTNSTNTITATPTDNTATVAITVGSTSVESGSSATWSEGENTVTIVVTNGTTSKTYTVTVTKS